MGDIQHVMECLPQEFESPINAIQQTTIQLINNQNAESVSVRKDNLDLSIALARSAESLARIEGYTYGMAEALKNQGVCYHLMGDFSNALGTLDASLKLFEELNDPESIAQLLQRIGIIYADIGDYAKALEAQIRALGVCVSHGDISGQANAFTNIGIMHSMAGNPERAIEYYHRSLEQYANLDNKLRRAIVLNSCCVDYTKLGKYQQAEEYGQQALDLFDDLGDLFGAGVTRSSLGEVALAILEYDKAIHHFEQALCLFETRGIDLISSEALETQINLAKTHHAIGNSDEALRYVKTVVFHAEEQNLQNLAMQCYQLISQIYELKGNLTAALHYLKKYTHVRDEILNESSQQEIHKLQIMHETQQVLADNERQKKLREQDRQKFERLAQIKDEFLHHTTHDIKNPLTVINISTTFLQRQITPENEKAHEHLRRISESTQKIKHLVEDMLDLAKMETTPTIHTEPVALNQWFEAVLREVKALAEEKNIRLMTEISPLDLICRCNKQRLGQALENLLSNAIKYTPNGGKVLLSASKTDTHIQIQITDNGIGIPEGAIPNLFDRFYRVDHNDNSIEGTGLGLSIVKLSVEQHHGTITVASKQA